MIKPILAQYIPLAHMIAQTIGDDCEVVLHDLENPQQSVVYIVNNRVTGRQVGQSFDPVSYTHLQSTGGPVLRAEI